MLFRPLIIPSRRDLPSSLLHSPRILFACNSTETEGSSTADEITFNFVTSIRIASSPKSLQIADFWRLYKKEYPFTMQNITKQESDDELGFRALPRNDDLSRQESTSNFRRNSPVQLTEGHLGPRNPQGNAPAQKRRRASTPDRGVRSDQDPSDDLQALSADLAHGVDQIFLRSGEVNEDFGKVKSLFASVEQDFSDVGGPLTTTLADKREWIGQLGEMTASLQGERGRILANIQAFEEKILPDLKRLQNMKTEGRFQRAFDEQEVVEEIRRNRERQFGALTQLEQQGTMPSSAQAENPFSLPRNGRSDVDALKEVYTREYEAPGAARWQRIRCCLMTLIPTWNEFTTNDWATFETFKARIDPVQREKVPNLQDSGLQKIYQVERTARMEMGYFDDWFVEQLPKFDVNEVFGPDF
ncbi:hypothetical protein V8F33_004738 [Rhypophila sp. PSN 637]